MNSVSYWLKNDTIYLDADNFVLILPKECHALRIEINTAAILVEEKFRFSF